VGFTKIYYNITDGNGCGNTDSLTIVVDSIPDAGILSAGPFCNNDPEFDLIANSAGGSYIANTFITTTGIFSPKNADVGFNKVFHTITNSFGCTSLDSISIEVYTIPNNTLSINPAKGCEVLVVNFATEPSDSIRWNVDGRIRVNETTFIDSFSNGLYNVNLEVLNSNGCRISLDSFVEVYPNPTAGFDYTPKDIYISDPEVFFEDKSLGNVVGWDWDFGDNNSSTQQNPSNIFNVGGTYQVVLFIEDNNGCIDSISQNVLVKDELLIFIPNAFSPNNDGLNDVFRITGLGFDNIEMSIYNRWGEKIYESNDFKEWNGIYRGADVQTGVYLYMMTITDSKGWKSYRSGEIHLVR
jgi:gliding motility-associated-like protein